MEPENTTEQLFLSKEAITESIAIFLRETANRDITSFIILGTDEEGITGSNAGDLVQATTAVLMTFKKLFNQFPAEMQDKVMEHLMFILENKKEEDGTAH